MEGVRYQEPHLKIMGIEAVKSSTPAPCREKIKDALKIIMRGTEKELNDFVCDFRDQFMEMEPEQIAFPRSCNGLGKFSESSAVYKKGTPMHVKGALLYNMLVDREKLSAKYPKIQEGDKIKFFYLRQPNPIASNVFSFITKTPVEVDIHKYIDYDTQFDKAFVEPMSFILEKIQWQIDRTYGTQGSLEDFFG
jgi:DNA polymerase elongation subunit (family B)